MPRLLRILLRWLGYFAATLVVLLAIAVGLFRLLVPELPEYREDIERRVSEAIGLDVRFAGLDARWRLHGPELIGTAVVVTEPIESAEVLSAERIVVGASVTRLIFDRRIVINRFEFEQVDIDVARDENGAWRLGATKVDDLLASMRGSGDDSGALPLAVSIDDLYVHYRDPNARRDRSEILVPHLEWSSNRSSASLTAELALADAGGTPLSLTVDREAADAPWNLYLNAVDTDFGAYLRTLPAAWPVPDTGFGTLELWLTLGGNRALSASANVDLSDVAVPLPGEAAPIAVGIKGHAEWQDNDEALLVGFDIDSLAVRDSTWPATRGELRLGRTDRGDLTLKLSYLRFDDLMVFADWLPDEWREQVVSASPQGDLIDTELEVSGWSNSELLYSLDSRFRDLTWQPVYGVPGVSGLSGQLSMDRASGRLGLDMGALTVTDPRLFPAPLDFSAIDGSLSWTRSRQGLTLIGNALRLRSVAFEAESDIELIVPEAATDVSIDLATRFTVTDLNTARDFLPRGVMKAPLQRWFDDALIAGRLENGELNLSGRLADFPYRDGNGRFEVKAVVTDTTLQFARNWPAAEVDSADISMVGLRLFSDRNRGNLLGNPTENVRVEIADVTEGVLTLVANASTRVPDGLNLIRNSPIRQVFGDAIERVSGDGQIDYSIDVVYPIKTKTDWTIDARIGTPGAELALAPIEQRLTELNGEVLMTRDSLSSNELRGVLLGSPIAIELLSGDREAGLAALAVINGAVSADGLRAEIGGAALDRLEGQADYRATVRFPSRERQDAALSIRLDSDLEGLGVSAPYPLGKFADAARRLQADVSFPAEGRIDLSGELEETGSWQLETATIDGVFTVERGRLTVGERLSDLPLSDGLWVDGRIESLRVIAGLDFVQSLDLPTGAAPVLRGLRFEADEVFAYGQRVADAVLQVDRNPREWLIQVTAPTADGAIFVPIDLESGDPIVLRMNKMHLIEDDPESSGKTDPRGVPPIIVDAEDFALGDQHYGRLFAQIEATETGLVATRLETTAPSFQSAGSGSWEMTEAEGEVSKLRIDITSTDTEATATSLGLDMGVIAESATASIDVLWHGPPSAELFESLDGEFSVRVGDGRLDEVDPGAGRVLGLMSVVEIPRRLSLDFRDVFAKGLTFSEITADFRLVNGEAFTCNLSLRAPSADIALIGRASLTRRDYNQTVVVSANVGDTLPAVGAVVGGPQVAAAMLVISRILRKPLKGLGQAYYQINGSWDDPSIERTTVERFYATSQLADCLQPSPQ
ncbi:MAG: YhdP family protein [Pseudomonadota bacterium]